MIDRLNHVAIAVRELEKAISVYRDLLGAHVSEVVTMSDHGVKVAFVSLSNTKIELMQPLSENSPIAKFVNKTPNGQVHHLCYEVPDLISTRNQLLEKGVRLLGNGKPRIGAHGKPVLFLHPKDFCGVLTEIEQA